MLDQDFGLYLHVPYCRALCHYCDFAKTANFTGDVASAYLARLTEHLQAWLDDPAVAPRLGRGLTSVFFGGGTPSLFGPEYEALFAVLAPRLAPGAEVTLEANPDDVTQERLDLWRALGVTRLSLGVQTFETAGLKLLHRIHGAGEAVTAIEAARRVFPNLNVDLIYGWTGQERADWARDLAAVLGLGVAHLSLYTLTYEPRTPLGRAALRGRLATPPDERLADFYDLARDELGAAGFAHEEVSNWARPGATCRHNWLYWQGGSFVGLGAGAHGYLGEAGGPGVRYAYSRNDRTFLGRAPDLRATDVAARYGCDVEADRTLDDWLTELVGGSLRTCRGVPLAAALARTGRVLRPTPVLATGLERGLVRLDSAGILELTPAEWFREQSWAVELLRSCVESS